MGRPAEGSIPASPRAEVAARLVRLFSAGATLTYLLVGVASGTGGSSARTPTLPVVLAAVVLGLLFHFFADVTNDVMDLPLDQTDPRRSADPLVSAVVSAPAALALALATLGPIFAVSAAVPESAWSLAGAVALLTLYNLGGKTAPVPFVGDLVQGAGWALLVLTGAQLAGGPTPLTAWSAAFVVGYVAMVNGVHGAIRDVQNDGLRGARTTASLLGARISATSEVELPLPLIATALAEHVLLCLLLLVPLVAGTFGYAWPILSIAGVCTVALLGAASLALGRAYRQRRSLRAAMAYGTWHLFLMPAALLAANLFRLPWWAAGVAVVAFLLPPKLFDLAVRGTPFGLPASDVAAKPPTRTPLGARCRAYWEMSRIGTPVAAMVLAFAGAVMGGGPRFPEVLLTMAGPALVVAGANIFNDRCDQLVDTVNRPDRPLPSGVVTGNGADHVVLGLTVAGVLVTVPLGAPAAATAGVLLALALAYSLPLRRRAFAGPFAVGALFGSALIYGGLFASTGLRPMTWFSALLVTVFVTGRETLKSVPDRRGDLLVGYQTPATRLGAAGAVRAFRATALVFVVATLLPIAFGHSGVLYLVAVVALVIVPTIRAVWRLRGVPTGGDVDAALHTTGLVFAGCVVPLLLLG